METQLGITQINFDESFIKSFDDMIPKKYKSNHELWIKIRDEYMFQTNKNKDLYTNILTEYTNLVDLKNSGVTIMSSKDQFSEKVTNMAQIILNQQRLYSNFLHYITHLIEDSFDVKSISTRTTRSRRLKLKN